MRVFINACVDPRIVQAFAGFEVRTAFDMKWHTKKDHDLIHLVDGAFDVFLTADRGFEFQHNRRGLTFGFVIVHVEKNQIGFYRPLFASIAEACRQVKPGGVIHVTAPVGL